MSVKQRITRLEQKLRIDDGMISVVVNYHPDRDEQERRKEQALAHAGLKDDKNVCLIIHYGDGLAKQWRS